MKILGISCSPRKGGNTETLVMEALTAAKELGADTELVTVAGKTIAPCDACEACHKTGNCKIADDMQDIYPKLLAADGIIFGSPVYYWSVSAQAKIIIDRTWIFRKDRRLRNKVAGAVIIARRTGASQTFSVFQNYFNIQRMIPASGAIAFPPGYEIAESERAGGVIAYGGDKGGVRQDERGMAEARNLGKFMVLTIRRYQEASLL